MLFASIMLAVGIRRLRDGQSRFASIHASWGFQGVTRMKNASKRLTSGQGGRVSLVAAQRADMAVLRMLNSRGVVTPLRFAKQVASLEDVCGSDDAGHLLDWLLHR